MKNLKWFINRIGKRIFRDSSGCKCDECKDSVENGVIIRDKFHAEYIYSIQCDFVADGLELNYRDKK